MLQPRADYGVPQPAATARVFSALGKNATHPGKNTVPLMLARRLRIVVRDREVADISDFVPRISAGVVVLRYAAVSAHSMTTSRTDKDAADRECGDQALGG